MRDLATDFTTTVTATLTCISTSSTNSVLPENSDLELPLHVNNTPLQGATEANDSYFNPCLGRDNDNLGTYCKTIVLGLPVQTAPITKIESTLDSHESSIILPSPLRCERR